MRFAEYCLEFSKKSRKVEYWHLILILKSILRRGPKVIRDFLWFVRANMVIEINPKYESNFPDIELVIVATHKDFLVLEKAIISAINSSVNKIINITIVVPPQYVEICSDLLKKIDAKLDYLVLNENNVIDQKLRALIKEKSDNRYGWLVQQFIKIKLALDSKFDGVLVVDADTLLLGRNIWLDGTGCQKLVIANNKHKPYLDFLQKLKISLNNPKFSFVTHHMLYQPNILKSLFKSLGCDTFESFVIKVLETKGSERVENLSIDFELYGQYAINTFEQKLKLARFCNLSLALSEVEISELFLNLDKFSEDYNSISFHSWH